MPWINVDFYAAATSDHKDADLTSILKAVGDLKPADRLVDRGSEYADYLEIDHISHGQTFGGASFVTSKDVLNIPHSAKAFGQLKKFMGNASYYKSLAKFEAKHPSAAISDSSTPVTAVSANPTPVGNAAIQVNYTPKVSAAGNVAKAETVKVRPVVSIKRADASAAKSSVPTRVRYSMEHYLSK